MIVDRARHDICELPAVGCELALQIRDPRFPGSVGEAVALEHAQ
jgi:hypothetical protein